MARDEGPKPREVYDRTSKKLLELLPEEISEIAFGEGLGPVFERRPTDLLVPPKQATDGVLLVGVAGAPGFHVRHIDFETTAQAEFPERLMRYNVLLRQQYDAPVRTVAFLLKPPDAEISGVHEVSWGGEPLHRFHYRVVRVYAIPWKKLASSLALAPFVPLGEGFATEPEKALRAALKTLGVRFELRGLLLDVAEAMSVPLSLQDKLFREEDRAMSVLFHEGEVKGRTEGRAEGKVEEAADQVRRRLVRRFPRQDAHALDDLLAKCTIEDLRWALDLVIDAPSGTKFATLRRDLESHLSDR